MRSSWIPIFYDKKDSKNYFYNFHDKRLVEGKYSSQGAVLSVASGIVGIIFFNLMKTIIFKINIYYLTLLSVISGLLVSIVFIILVDNYARRSVYNIDASPEIIAFCFEEGAKQLKINLIVACSTLLLAISNTVLLYLSKGESILFFSNVLFWMIPVPIFVLQRPFKRMKIHTLFKNDQLIIKARD